MVASSLDYAYAAIVRPAAAAAFGPTTGGEDGDGGDDEEMAEAWEGGVQQAKGSESGSGSESEGEREGKQQRRRRLRPPPPGGPMRGLSLEMGRWVHGGGSNKDG